MANDQGLWPSIRRTLGIQAASRTRTITERNVAGTGLALILSGVAGLVLVFAYGQPQGWSVAITAVIVAAASLGVGFLLGFLFGIPRSRRQDSSPTTTTGAGSQTSSATTTSGASTTDSQPQASVTAVASSSSGLTVNANLEEISDWLTKIIVGIGLIELNNIPRNLDRLARYVASGLVPTPPATPAPPPPVAFALAIIVYFSVLGFLSGYLLTRLFLAGAFSAADEALERLRGDLQKKTEEVERQKERVDHVIEGAEQSARTKAIVMTPSAEPTVDQRAMSPTARLAELETTYKELRKLEPGDHRTRQMTEVVAEMRALAPQLRDFDVRAALSSPRREERLAAHAVIYAQPQPELLEPLVDSLISYTAEARTDFDNRPFGEYWGIQALEKVLGVSRKPFPPDLVKKLVAWASRLPKGTDRWFEMVRVFRQHGIPAAL